MPIRRELIDELLKDYSDPQDILAEGGLLKQLTKAVIERCLETELDTHLGKARACAPGQCHRQPAQWTQSENAQRRAGTSRD